MRKTSFLALALGCALASPSTSFAGDCLDYSAFPQWVGDLQTPSARSIAGFGNVIYLGADDSLIVLDTSDPRHPRRLGGTPMMTPVDIASLGPILFICTLHQLLVLDAHQPQVPTVLGRIDLPSPYGVTLEGNRAYVACWDQGVIVIDVSNFTHPVIVGQANTPGKALHVEVEGTVVFVSDYDGGISIIDFANLAVPAYLAFISNPNSAGRSQTCALRQNQLYVSWDNMMRVYDVQDPAHPRLAFENLRLPNADAIAVQIDRAFVGFFGQIAVLDFANGVPRVTAQVRLRSAIRDILVRDNFIFIADADAGLQIVEAPQAENAPLLAQVPGYAGAVVAAGSRVYLTAGPNLDIYDLAVPASPVLLGTLPHAFGVLAATQDIAVLRAHFTVGSLTLVDAHDPTAPIVASVWKGPGYDVSDVDLDGSDAFVAFGSGYAGSPSSWHGLVVVDISDPLVPHELGRVAVRGNVNAVAARAGLACFITSDSLFTIDVSTPTSPRQLGALRLAISDPLADATDILLDGTYAYVGLDQARLDVVDVSAPAHPTVVAEIEVPTGADRFAFHDGILYVLDHASRGAELIDVHDPLRPQRIGFASGGSPYSSPEGIAAVDGAFLLAHPDDGLKIFAEPCPRTTPVAFADLEATRGADGVLLRAQFAQGADAVSVLRTEGTSLDAAVEIHLDTYVAAGSWQYLDPTALAGVAYTYALDITMDGEHQRSVALRVPARGVARFALTLASRNPTPGPVRLSFTVARPGPARLDVYDAAGRFVRRLHAGVTSGAQLVVWDGRDEAGVQTAAGLYFARLESAGQSASVRIVRTR